MDRPVASSREKPWEYNVNILDISTASAFKNKSRHDNCTYRAIGKRRHMLSVNTHMVTFQACG
jgi:hypothetical protein